MPPNSEHPAQTLESPAEAKSAAPHPQKKPVAVQTKHQSIPYTLTPSDDNKIKAVKRPRPLPAPLLPPALVLGSEGGETALFAAAPSEAEWEVEGTPPCGVFSNRRM